MPVTAYDLDLLSGRPAAVICESELDAVLLWQETGDLVDVVAIGAKASRSALSFLAHLASASLWLLALDCDAETEAGRWGAFSDRIRRMRPLVGNDITDFGQQGSNLRAWAALAERAGWPCWGQRGLRRSNERQVRTQSGSRRA
ncbi:MAG: hypothetical protein GX601_05755 [Anaerolineales bacterium]|nr:hypothetical protein [Anaerolineales bacterium]